MTLMTHRQQISQSLRETILLGNFRKKASHASYTSFRLRDDERDFALSVCLLKKDFGIFTKIPLGPSPPAPSHTCPEVGHRLNTAASNAGYNAEYIEDNTIYLSRSYFHSYRYPRSASPSRRLDLAAPGGSERGLTRGLGRPGTPGGSPHLLSVIRYLGVFLGAAKQKGRQPPIRSISGC